MKLLELAVRTFCDVEAKGVVDAAYLFGQTSDNQFSVLSAGAALIDKRRTGRLLLTESAPKSGYPGYACWKKELLQLGVPAASISGVDLREEDCLNTLIEAVGMMSYAKKNHYARLYIVASPFHQLRAFMTSVTAALRIFPEVKIYSHTGNPLSWSDKVSHSQGKTIGSRKEVLQGELERIRAYQKKGDLAHEMDVLNYLDTRDTNRRKGWNSSKSRLTQ